MKKVWILLSAALTAGVVFTAHALAYSNVNKGCTACHSADTLHSNDAMNTVCTNCHVNPAGDTSVTPATCIVCHPEGSPGLCGLVNSPGHSSSGCGNCHSSCVPVTTTVHTTSTTTTTTTTTAGVCPAEQVLEHDSADLEKLRVFRDGPLARSALGRRVIQIYYDNAGSINAALASSPALKSTVRSALVLAAAVIGLKQ